jgi:hypothetical protein
MTSSVAMLSKNVFEREIQHINSRIRFLNEQPYDDETDIRLAQEEIWALEENRKYLQQRVKELT